MKKFIAQVLLVVCGMFLLNVTNALAQKTMGKEAVMMPAESMKWEEMKGGPPGVTYCNVWGDLTKGAYGAFIKLPPNMNNPLHAHSSDTRVVIVEGSFYMTDASGKRTELGPGSYFMEPGMMKHTSGTMDKGATLFQQGTGKFDFLVDKAPDEKK
ncbi:MAG TPA: DUF4437 domain-containing protein [Bacteroidota bacterium]